MIQDLIELLIANFEIDSNRTNEKLKKIVENYYESKPRIHLVTAANVDLKRESTYPIIKSLKNCSNCIIF